MQAAFFVSRETTLGIYICSLIGMVIYTFTLDLGMIVVYVVSGVLGWVEHFYKQNVYRFSIPTSGGGWCKFWKIREKVERVVVLENPTRAVFKYRWIYCDSYVWNKY